MMINHFATFAAFLLFLQVVYVSSYKQMKVKDKDGNIQYRDCVKCGAGMEPHPRCGGETVYDERTFKQYCVECERNHFKAELDGRPNDLQCKPCDDVKCRENYEERYPCSKTHPADCLDSCKKGFEKDNAGNCIKQSVTTDHLSTLMTTAKTTQKKLDRTMTQGNPTVTIGHSGTSTTTNTTLKKLNPLTNLSTKGTSVTRNRNVSHGNSGLTEWEIFGIVIGLVFALVLALVIWFFLRRRRRRRKRRGQNQNGYAPPQDGTQNRLLEFQPLSGSLNQNGADPPNADLNQNGAGSPNAGLNQNGADPPNAGLNENGADPPNAGLNQNGADPPNADVNQNGAGPPNAGPLRNLNNPAYDVNQDFETICCYCRLPAGQLYHEVLEMRLKMRELASYLPDEKAACNEIFNRLSGRELPNNRISTTDDLHDKIYSELPGITLAKFLLALYLTGRRGVLEIVHDVFHPEG